MISITELSEALRLRRSGRQWRGQCPVHGGGSDPFSLTEGDAGRPIFYCFAGCDAGDILAELRRRGLIDPLSAPAGDLTSHSRRAAVVARATDRKPLDWSNTAAAIWGKGRQPHGTTVETYLAARGCHVPNTSEIRYLPPSHRHPWPTMMARISDAITAAPISLHFTLLRLDGSGKAPVARPKVLLPGHRKAGGVIRLSDDADVTFGLGIAEGIETSLAVIGAGWSPVWCAIDAGNIAAFPVLQGLETLTVFSDHDATGLKAATACLERWKLAGKECAIAAPPEAGTDWNDLERRAHG